MEWLVGRAYAVNVGFLNMATTASANLPGFVNSVINIMLFIAGAAAVIYLIYSGILYISAAGNPDAAKKGQQGIINAIIGIVIIVLAYFIASAVANYAAGVGNNPAPATILIIRSIVG